MHGTADMAVYNGAEGMIMIRIQIILIFVLFTAVAMHTYHKIILAEEKFLLDRFGPAYAAYTARVNRYFIF